MDGPKPYKFIGFWGHGLPHLGVERASVKKLLGRIVVRRVQAGGPTMRVATGGHVHGGTQPESLRGCVIGFVKRIFTNTKQPHLDSALHMALRRHSRAFS